MAEPEAERRFFGWIPSPPDFRDRDFAFYAPRRTLQSLPPAVDLALETMPLLDQGNIGSCFPAGTLVRMADGSEKPINEVRLGEEVVTAEGRTGTVLQLMMRKEIEGLVKVCLWGRSAIKMTPEHPVFTKRGYVKASELTLSDFVAMPRYRPQEVTESFATSSFISRREALLKTGQRKCGVIPGRAETAVTVSTVPETIALTVRFGRLVGFFLAEGSSDSGKVRWTFGAHEEETLVTECVDLLSDLGVEAHIQHRPNNSINVVVYGTAWARLWERLCGNGAGAKVPHPTLMGGSDEFLEAVLRGWLAGDGHNMKKRGATERTRGKSVSKALAMAMFDIAQHLGLRPSFRIETAKASGKVKSRRTVYIVELCSQLDGDNWRSEQTGTHIFRKVRSIEAEPYDGPVYNMGVEGDNSYVAEGIGVHNCGPHSSSQDILYDLQKRNVPNAPMPSRLFIYYVTRTLMGTTSQDSGVDNRSMLKALAQYGWCDETLWPYNTSQFTVRPPVECYTQGATRKIVEYNSVPQDLDQMRACLAGGDPFIFGFTVFSSFQSAAVAQTGIVPMPRAGEQRLGGHDVWIVGFDDATQRFKFRNSWGRGWGVNGYGTFPYAYCTSPRYSADFWTVKHAVWPMPIPPDPPPVPPTTEQTVVHVDIRGLAPINLIVPFPSDAVTISKN